MKSILTSAGVVAIGVIGVQAQDASLDSSKPWNVSASLRGFYDDNYATRPSTLSRDSFGFELAPRASFHPQLEQTTFVVSYAYSMKYYEDRQNNSADHTHEADVQLRHQFTPRLKLSVSDSFVIAQEPEILNPQGTPIAGAAILRLNGNNYRNQAGLNGSMELNEEFELQAGYSNTTYDYEEEGDASYSALLDRMEHLASLNLRWRFMPDTVGVLGYQYGQMEFRSNDRLVGLAGSPTSEIRDNRSHYVFLGGDHTFNPQLNGAIRVGAQFIEYVNALPGAMEDDVSPYADANLTWTYNPGSTLQAGVKHTRVATDLTGLGGGNLTDPTMDQQSTTFYAAINHRVTPKLTASVNGMFQNGGFQGGAFDGMGEQIYLASLNLNYQINTYLAAESGYSYDRLDSDVDGRSFSRNRVFIGIRGTY